MAAVAREVLICEKFATKIGNRRDILRRILHDRMIFEQQIGQFLPKYNDITLVLKSFVEIIKSLPEYDAPTKFKFIYMAINFVINNLKKLQATIAGSDLQRIISFEISFFEESIKSIPVEIENTFSVIPPALIIYQNEKWQIDFNQLLIPIKQRAIELLHEYEVNVLQRYVLLQNRPRDEILIPFSVTGDIDVFPEIHYTLRVIYSLLQEFESIRINVTDIKESKLAVEKIPELLDEVINCTDRPYQTTDNQILGMLYLCVFLLQQESNIGKIVSMCLTAEKQFFDKIISAQEGLFDFNIAIDKLKSFICEFVEEQKKLNSEQKILAVEIEEKQQKSAAKEPIPVVPMPEPPAVEIVQLPFSEVTPAISRLRDIQEETKESKRKYIRKLKEWKKEVMLSRQEKQMRLLREKEMRQAEAIREKVTAEREKLIVREQYLIKVKPAVLTELSGYGKSAISLIEKVFKVEPSDIPYSELDVAIGQQDAKIKGSINGHKCSGAHQTLKIKIIGEDEKQVSTTIVKMHAKGGKERLLTRKSIINIRAAFITANLLPEFFQEFIQSKKTSCSVARTKVEFT